MKTTRPEETSASISTQLAVEGEQLAADHRAGALIWRAIAAAVAGIVAVVFSLANVRAMDLLPADPLLRILQPVIPLLSRSMPFAFELDPRMSRVTVAVCALLTVVLALPWFRAARRQRLAQAGGPLLYSCGVGLSAIWTLIVCVAPRALELRAIPYDAPAATTAIAVAIIMGAQAIAVSRLRDIRERLHDQGVAADTVVRDALPEQAQAGLRRARILTITAIVSALLAATVWTAVGSLSSLPNAIVAVIAILFGTAPIAFGLSGSLPWTAGVIAAAGAGLRATNARTLEAISRSRAIVAGLGGSVISEEARVSDSAMLEVEQKELLSIAAGVELFARHPVATAIVRRAESLRPDLPGSTDVYELPGEGSISKLDGRDAAVGSLAMMKRLKIPVEMVEEEIHQWESTGRTGVVVASGGVVIGAIAVSHETTSHASEAVAALGRSGLHRTLVSGSSPERAGAYASALGFDEHFTGDAAARIDVVKQQKNPVLAVGRVDDASWMEAADARVLVALDSGNLMVEATADPAAPLRAIVAGIDAGTRANAATRRGLLHATGHHLIGIPLVSGVIFPLAHWTPPSWLVWVASPIFAALFTAVATIAVTADRVDHHDVR